ncbi:hypothetical protein LTS10_004381 [Elasticomyces elasticus]|nr:hypothetical protein LTS10_004381 [Elasticomyces elasticus]
MVQDQAVDVRSTALTRPCHLLNLPPELRLIIYEALFGFKRKRNIYWDDHDGSCFFNRRKARNKHYAALLGTCQKIRDEAQPVLNQSNVPWILDTWWYRRGGREPLKHEHILQADQLQFLRQVPKVMVDITLKLNEDEGWNLLNVILASIGHGQKMKSLVFIKDDACDYEVFEDGGRLTAVTAKLRCPSSAVTIQEHGEFVDL